MKRTGAALAVYALEQLPIRYTFGIPGVHNTELYDELSKSKKIKPLLVTHEGGGAFMADAVSRTSNEIGALVIVPAAGTTHALSGIGEAFLDGIPMIIISGGIRRDTGKSFQLHEIDQRRILEGITKRYFLVQDHREIVPTIFEAYRIAVSGEPGPVFIEIPADIQLFSREAGGYRIQRPALQKSPLPDSRSIDEASQLLARARHPGIFAGWGARESTDMLVELAELLDAPVAVSLQGYSVFPGNHPLFTGMGFSRAAVPAAYHAFRNCDCLLAVGVRFGEIPTGSFGVEVPPNLIHADINPAAFNRNYPATVTIEGDSNEVLGRILTELKSKGFRRSAKRTANQIAKDRAKYLNEWKKLKTERVNPAAFFAELRSALSDDAIVAVDDGNHTYLAAELFTSLKPRHFISPTDFNCMGYCVPAAIGAKLANPGKEVVGIAGDGSFLMTCMEILVASREKLGVAFYVFNDGELSQISQSQKVTYGRSTCTTLGEIDFEGLAKCVGADYLEIDNNSGIRTAVENSLKLTGSGIPVVVNVRVDYSKATSFTSGVLKTVFKRFPVSDKARFAGRSLARKVRR